MDKEKKRPFGLAAPLTFWKVGALLFAAFVIFGGIWLAMEHYRVQVEEEYYELLFSQTSSQEEKKRFQNLQEQYRNIYVRNRYGFSRSHRRIGSTAVIAGIGLFLWLLTLLRRGIVWLAKRS